MFKNKLVFAQLMEFLPRHDFDKCVRRYRGNFRTRDFSCRDQFLAMAFAQLTYRESLRDIETCLRSVQPKLYHMGFRGRIARSTMADANRKRDWRIYADFAQTLIGRARKLCRRSHQAGLPNLKVLRLESLYTVEWLLPPQSISRIHLLFPDPWPKARHHKRRLVQAPFLKAAQTALIPGGEFLFRTDHAEYFEWAAEELEAFEGLEVIDWLPEDEFYAETDFQRQWAEVGRSVYSLRAVTAS